MYQDAYKISIRDVSDKLNLERKGNAVRCFNYSNHKNGDATPSLQLNIKSNTWFCHVCNFRFGKRGNMPYGTAVDLVMMVLNADYGIAKDWLNINFGIVPAYDSTKGTLRKESEKIASLKQPKRDLDEEIKSRNRTYTELQKISKGHEKVGNQYLKKRGFEKWVIKGYKFFSIRKDTFPLLKNTCGVKVLEQTGLIINGKFIFSVGSMVIPFYYFDDLVFLQGHNPNNKPKYKNVAVELLFPFHINNLLFDDIGNDLCFIAEGVFDTLSLAQSDTKAIGLIGADSFKSEWVNYFKRREVTPVISLDNDAAGIKASKRIANIFYKEGIQCKNVSPSQFGDFKDWNEIIQKDKTLLGVE